MPHVHAVAIVEAPDDRLGAGRAADRHPLQGGQLRPALIEELQEPGPDRGHRAGDGDPLGFQQLVDGGAVELAARHHQLGPDRRAGEGHPPGVGVIHRSHRQDGVGRREPDDVGLQAHQGVQEVRAVRVEHPLGVAGGARGVAEAAGGLLGEAAPGAVLRLAGDQILIVLVQHHHPLDRGRGRDARLQQRSEGLVDEDHPVFGVVDDPADLVGVQARIEGVADRPDPHDPVPDLQVPPAVPGQGGHPVAGPHAHLEQGVRDPLGPCVDLGIGGAVDRPFQRAGDHLAPAVALGGMTENPVDRQRPSLHHPQHGDPPRPRCLRIMTEGAAPDES